MRSVKRYFQTANAVFIWLWLLSFLFSVWTAIGFVAWFLPFNTAWISFVRHYTSLYLLAGCLIHLFTIISHQQALYVWDFPSHPHTNLTFSLFLHRAIWLLLWNSPCYVFTVMMILNRLRILNLIQKGNMPGIFLSVLIVLLMLLFTILFLAVYGTGTCIIYRNQGKPNLFFLFTVWFRSIKAVFSHLTVWLTTYSLITGIFICMGLFLWFFWTLWIILYAKPAWNIVYPECWLLSFILTCIGLESFSMPLFSIASAETNQSTLVP